jgi:hypothetical protein
MTAQQGGDMMRTDRRKVIAAAVGGVAARVVGTPEKGRAQGDGTDIRTPAPSPEPLLPGHRILSYYGFPGNNLMGILGEYSKAELRKRLIRQLRAYERVDNSRPWRLAYEVIASVAQRDPMPDGSYLTRTDPRIIDDYATYTAQHDMLLILDMQFGRRSVEEELEAALPWLALPHVHLALDPEFKVKEGEQPGVHLGSIEAADITYAQETLADFASRRGLPPKLLIVHQFHYAVIENKDRLRPVPGVQFILEVDGFGTPDEKRETYRVMTQNPIEYHGFKLWYRQDEPLMTEEEVLALNPSPDLIIYQ